MVSATWKRERPVEIVASPPLPTTAGTLKGAGRGLWYASLASGPPPIDAVSAELVIYPTPELDAYRAVTGFRVVVDDSIVTAAYYGGRPVAGGIALTSLWAACTPADARDYPTVQVTPGQSNVSLSPQVHTVRVEPYLLVTPAVSLPPLVTTLDFTCGVSGSDAGASDAGAGVTRTNDASPSTADTSTDPTGGCRVGRARGDRGFGGFVLTILAVLIQRKRREQRQPRGRLPVHARDGKCAIGRERVSR